MRISCNLNDRGFSPECFKFDIYLNGEIINNAITADEEEGFIMAYAVDESGKYQLNESKTEVLKELFSGTVRIVKSDHYL